MNHYYVSYQLVTIYGTTMEWWPVKLIEPLHHSTIDEQVQEAINQIKKANRYENVGITILHWTDIN